MIEQASQLANPESEIVNAPALFVEGLEKTFRGAAGETIEVLRGASFSAEAGEMVAVTGASGAGKSTLLHLLGGLDEADAGTIRLDHLELTRAKQAELARLRNELVGFVFQAHHLLPDLTTLENAAMPLLIGRASWKQARERASHILQQLGLAERLDHKTGALSGGEQQRVALARALVKEPRLVLADEPTGNLDAATGEEIGALLASFCHEHKALVLIATHNQQLAQSCDRLLVLEDGKLSEALNLKPRGPVQTGFSPEI
ncbi:MAG TPA: ABC transporter ATP-binding protein [Pyrinomonadaceae bacterium]|jgi:lipoprotein-releasing system ATP-binding protein